MNILVSMLVTLFTIGVIFALIGMVGLMNCEVKRFNK